MSADREKNTLLSPEEQLFITRVAANYTPSPQTATQRAAFDRALQERLARPQRLRFFRPMMLLAPACAAVLLWLATGEYRVVSQNTQSSGVPLTETTSTSQHEATSLLLFAYEDAELYGDEGDEEKDTFLPDEYQALTTVFFPADA